MHSHEHEYDPLHETIELIIPAYKGLCVMCLENFCVHVYQQRGLMIDERNISKFSPLYKMCMTSTYSVHVS